MSSKAMEKYADMSEHIFNLARYIGSQKGKHTNIKDKQEDTLSSSALGNVPKPVHNGNKGIWTRYGYRAGGHNSRLPIDSLASSLIGK